MFNLQDNKFKVHISVYDFLELAPAVLYFGINSKRFNRLKNSSYVFK